MSTSILGSVTLGYEPIWNQWRKRAGVRLAVDVEAGTQVDARHFLDAIAEQGCGTAQPLLLSVRSPTLLQDLLQHPLTPSIWIEIQNDWLGDAAVTARVRAARQRGAQLVWRGEPGRAPAADVKDLFHKTLRTLSPQEALGALRSSARQTASSPIVAGSLYEGLASPRWWNTHWNGKTLGAWWAGPQTRCCTATASNKFNPPAFWCRRWCKPLTPMSPWGKLSNAWVTSPC